MCDHHEMKLGREACEKEEPLKEREERQTDPGPVEAEEGIGRSHG